MTDEADAATTAPRWQRRPEARPEEILDAALEVFGEHGFAQAKLEDVARLAGVSKGTLYLYFDSKETLFREMVQAKAVAAVRESEAFVEAFQGSSRDLLVELMKRKYAIMRNQQLSRISKLVQSELAALSRAGATSTAGGHPPGAASGRARCSRAASPPGSSGRRARLRHARPADAAGPGHPDAVLLPAVRPGSADRRADARRLIDFALNGVLARPEPQR